MYEEIFRIHSELLKAMSHPRRLEIIHLLRGKTLTVTEIQNMLHLPQANISQHLQILREAGIVVTSKKGKQVLYRLAHRNFIKACDLMRDVLVEKYTKDPLATALEKLHSHNKTHPMGFGNPATSSLFIVNPFDTRSFFITLFSTHPPYNKRTERLRAMKF